MGTEREHIIIKKDKYTWADLKRDLEKISPEQLEKETLMLIDDEHLFRKNVSLCFVEEDIYYNVDDNEDGGTLEELKELHGDDFDEKDYWLSTSKGTAFLYDFEED